MYKEPVVLHVPKVWELLNDFKNCCRAKGWKTSEHEDWVKVGDEYHNFLWTQTVHPATFNKIASNNRCAIRKGVTYQVVNVAYTAWVFPQLPPEGLLETVKDNPELARRTAIYDLSSVYEGCPSCLKLNETESTVFREFEKFLKDKLGVEVKSVCNLSAQKIENLSVHGITE